MPDSVIQLPADSTGKMVDHGSLTVGANTVHRQRVVLSDSTGAAGLAVVTAATLVGTEVGLVTRSLVAPMDFAVSSQAISASVAAGTAGTANTTAICVTPVATAGSALISLSSGTYTSLLLAFEASDDGGTTWFAIQGARVDGSGVESTTGTLVATTNRAWDFSLTGLTHLRARCNTFTATANPTVRISANGGSYEPSPIVTGAGVAGTPSGGVITVQGVASGTAQPVSGTVTITPPTLNKGSQGATGLSTQDLKDAGRTFITFYVDAAASVTTEALMTMSIQKGQSAPSSATTYTTSTGKTLRIQSISVATTGSAAGSVKIRLRTGSVSLTTSGFVIYAMQNGVNGAGLWATNDQCFPDGIEISGSVLFGIFQLGTATTNNTTITVTAFEY